MDPGNFCMNAKTGQLPKANWTKTGQFPTTFLTAGEAAQMLGVSQKTVIRWCKAGKLLGIPKPHGNSHTYTVTIQAIQLFQATHPSLVAPGRPKTKPEPQEAEPPKEPSKPHREYLEAWEKAMNNGLMNGKPFSAHTTTQYVSHLNKFLAKYGQLSYENLKAEMLDIPVEQFGRKDKFFKAVVCFGKFLAEESALDVEFLNQAKKLKPKRHKPPKQLTVNEDQLQQMLAVCSSSLERALLLLLASTGLRASECCNLTLDDVDLHAQTLLVRLGKGNKRRSVGLNALTIEALRVYLGERPKHTPKTLFLNQLGEPMDRHGLRHRVERLGKLAGVEVSPHALRRAFVTINANKGRSLVMLQMACGHADIKTTRAYCRTTEEEVIAAMKFWE